ncbi:MAG: AbrB/MazE/SpoVT family DNA-binding domain-containing protein [Firmicutes bacterium]|nr:AbrB/MazE/SpoVT family DNA-binding domain-containing protein [Bacillota bacterium]
MKATGVVRRIDELGRIVIPKEIRKTLRIREGENLEIYIDDQDQIILKKYFIMNNMVEESGVFAESIYALTHHNVVITDTDKVIAVGGTDRKTFLDKSISEQIKNAISRRDKILEKGIKPIQIVENEEMSASFTYATIIVGGDATGIIIMYSSDELTETDKKIVELTSQVLAKQLES